MKTKQTKFNKSAAAIYIAFSCFIAVIIYFNVSKVKKDIYKSTVENQQEIALAIVFQPTFKNINIKLSSTPSASYLESRVDLNLSRSDFDDKDFDQQPFLNETGIVKASSGLLENISTNCEITEKSEKNEFACQARLDNLEAKDKFLFVKVNEIPSGSREIRIEIERRPGIREQIQSFGNLFGL